MWLSDGCGSKNRCQNGTLVSGHMDQNLRNPLLLNFLSHPLLGFPPIHRGTLPCAGPMLSQWLFRRTRVAYPPRVTHTRHQQDAPRNAHSPHGRPSATPALPRYGELLRMAPSGRRALTEVHTRVFFRKREGFPFFKEGAAHVFAWFIHPTFTSSCPLGLACLIMPGMNWLCLNCFLTLAQLRRKQICTQATSQLRCANLNADSTWEDLRSPPSTSGPRAARTTRGGATSWCKPWRLGRIGEFLLGNLRQFPQEVRGLAYENMWA